MPFLGVSLAITQMQRAVSPGAVSPVGPTFSINIPGLSVSADAVGDDWDLTISGDAAYNGTYRVTAAQLDSGLPIHLVDPVIIESPANVFTRTKEALFLAPTDDHPLFVEEWIEGGVVQSSGASYDATGTFGAVDYRLTAQNLVGAAPVYQTEVRAGFTEQGFVLPAGTRLSTTEQITAMPNALLFASFEAAPGDVDILASGSSQMNARNVSLTAMRGRLVEIHDFISGLQGVTTGTRVNLLVSFQGGIGSNAVLQIADWTVLAKTKATASADVSAQSIYLGSRWEPTAVDVTLYRLYIKNLGATPPPDVLDSAVYRQFFQSDGSLTSPSVSEAAYGQGEFEYHIKSGFGLTELQALQHLGSLDSGGFLRDQTLGSGGFSLA